MVYIHSFLPTKASCHPTALDSIEICKPWHNTQTPYNFPFMKREYSSMTHQNSYESDQENGQSIKSLKPCEFEHHNPRSHQCKDGEKSPLQQSSAAVNLLLENTRMPNQEAEGSREDTGRERLKRHRIEVGGRVWIPDIWGQEELLKDWIDCSAFDAAIMNSSIMSARAALVEEGRRAHSSRLKI